MVGSIDGGSDVWTVDLDVAPNRYPHVAAIEIGRQLLLAHEGCNQPLVLDPVSAAIWSFLDGRTCLADILDDLVGAFGGPSALRRHQLEELVLELGGGAFIDSIRPGAPPVARRLDPPIADKSCLAMAMGLSRGQLRQVNIDGQPVLRFGATDHELVSNIVDTLPPEASIAPLDERWIETVWARLTVGRHPRVQTITTTLGEWLFATRSLPEARDALRRSVVGLISANRDPRSIWASGPMLITPAGITLLHPAIGAHAVAALRAPLQSAGVSAVPAAIVRLQPHADGIDAVQPGTTFEGAEPAPAQVLAVVLPAATNDAGRIGGLAHVLRRWDQVHFGVLPLLASQNVEELSPGLEPEAYAATLARIAHGSAVDDPRPVARTTPLRRDLETGPSVTAPPVEALPSGLAFDFCDANAHRLIRALGLPHDLERSLKVGPGSFLPDRFLLSYRADQLMVSPRDLVELLDVTDSVSERFPAGFEHDVRAARWIHLGYERGQHGTMCKLYLELQDSPAGKSRLPVQAGTHLVHRAYKWLSGAATATTARYVGDPSLDDRSRERLVASNVGDPGGVRSTAIHALLTQAHARADQRELMMLEVSEDDSPRRSIDLNLNPAGLVLGDVLSALQELFDTYGCGSQARHFIQSNSSAQLGHVSTGASRDGNEFLTLYFRDPMWNP